MQLRDYDAPDGLLGCAQDDDYGDYGVALHHRNDWDVPLAAMRAARRRSRNDCTLVAEEAFLLSHSHLPEIRRPIISC